VVEHPQHPSEFEELPVAAINRVVDLSVEGDVAVVTLDSPPVNALSADLRAGLAEAVAKANADPAVKAIALICAGRTFIAGADITEFGKPPREPSLPDMADGIEASAKPVVAAIHGTALGGGLETALACHGRVADTKAKLGLPEVKLGLLPGAGGTQRLPRLIGVEKALGMITSGDQIGAAEALKLGLVDRVVEPDQLRPAAIEHARSLVGKPLKKVRELEDKLDAARADPELFARFRAANAKKFRGFQAPENIMKAVQAGLDLPYDQAILRERELFMELMTGVQSAAQRYFFFAERKANKIPGLADDLPTRLIRKVGIIGAGTMGGGISMAFINAGLPVTLVEMKQEALDRGLGVIRKNYESSAKKGRMTQEEVERRMGLYSPALDVSAVADCDLIIEAVFENMDVKKDLFTRLEAVVRPDALLASNTSYLDIDEIASVTKHPERVLGLHFFSPANIMKLVEVVRAAKTAPDVVATAMKLAKPLGKVAVLSGVCHGFIGNRMLARRRDQAERLVLEGAMPWDVDRVLVDFGLPMGPYAMSDLAGLDLGWSKETSKGETLREMLCDRDRRGQKTSAGYYDYDENRKATPSPITEELVKEFSKRAGVERNPISDQEILERCLYPMVDEGSRILEEGIALRGSDVDVVWVYGYGWPIYRGGPMFWADTVGLKEVVARLDHYAATLGGKDFGVSGLLRKLADEGGSLKDYEAG
jgi:3-hydroxyacyl-CoA dehydrogenase